MPYEVTLERCGTLQHTALENLIQLYTHDFSEFWRPGMQVDLGEDGRFPPFPGLDSYWTEPDRSVWFIRAGDALAGFALINTHSHSGLLLDFNVGEFFVARPYRGNGLGAQAVKELLNAHPGRWEAAIAARNIPAQNFWPRAIATANVAQIETLQGDGVEWTGPILRFIVRQA